MNELQGTYTGLPACGDIEPHKRHMMWEKWPAKMRLIVCEGVKRRKKKSDDK